MKLTPIVKLNAAVVDNMRTAHKSTEKALKAFNKGADADKITKHLDAAITSVKDARAGASELRSGGKNVLQQPFSNYANHAVRDLQSARAGIQNPHSSRNLLAGTLEGAERNTRLSLASGERSLVNPRLQGNGARVGGSGSGGSGGSGSVSNGGHGRSGYPDVDDLDAIGNPARGGNRGAAGPDGTRYGWDGSPSRDSGGSVGPDGVDYSDLF